MKFQEKRIYLIQVSSHITACSANILFNSRLPLCREKVLFEKGLWQEVSQGKKTFIIMICTSMLLKEVEDILQLVIRSKDITPNLVNETDYVLLPHVIADFDYVKFEKAYTELYLQEAPVSFAERQIIQMGSKSRYIDHQVVYNHRTK